MSRLVQAGLLRLPVAVWLPEQVTVEQVRLSVEPLEPLVLEPAVLSRLQVELRPARARATVVPYL